jgi:hypothetical protein
MHGSLYCSAFTAYIFGTSVESSYCTAECCHQQPETLTHLFMDCDVVRPAVDWVLDLWALISGSRPPRSALVLLADDRRVWRPADKLADLWDLLRLEFLYAAWSARCGRNGSGRAVQAAGVVAVLVAKLRRHMELDWLRTTTDVRKMSTACSSWFKGKDPGMIESGFVERWGPAGLLCAVQSGTAAIGIVPALPMRMTVLLSVSVPLPLPISLAPLPRLPDDLY